MGDNKPMDDPAGNEPIGYSVIVPIYNEEANLDTLHHRLTTVMQSLGKPYEIIYIDDGSRDGSYGVLERLQQANANVKVVRFTRNFGQASAVAAGFDTALGGIVITIDADLEQPPEEIPKLLSKLEEGYDVVFGILRGRKHSWVRRAGSALSKRLLSKVIPVDVTEISGYKAMRSEVIDYLQLCGERTRFLSGIICWTGASVGTVDVEHHRRASGRSKYGILRLVAAWLDLIISFTEIPLRLASIGGIGLGLAGLVLAFFYMVRYLIYGFSVPGFATIVILLLVFFGFQFLFLGVLGEYLGRVNMEVRHRPRYIVRNRLGISSDRNQVIHHNRDRKPHIHRTSRRG